MAFIIGNVEIGSRPFFALFSASEESYKYWKEDIPEFLEVTSLVCEKANYVADIWDCRLQDGWFPRIDADRQPIPTDQEHSCGGKNDGGGVAIKKCTEDLIERHDGGKGADSSKAQE